MQIVEQTKEIQASTQAALQDQGDQMRRIEADVDKVWGAVGWQCRFNRVCMTDALQLLASANLIIM
jgi:hypothetical protein